MSFKRKISFKRLIVFIVAIIFCVLLTQQEQNMNKRAASACTGAQVNPGEDIQAAIDTAGAGGTVCINAGIYSINNTLKPQNNQKIIGVGNPILTGNDTTQYAINGSASNVLIQGLIWEKFHSPDQRGAVEPGQNWTLDGNEGRNNYSAAVFWSDVGGKATNNNFHDNGQEGATANGQSGNSVLDIGPGNTFAHNNFRLFKYDDECGGMKITNAGGFKIHDNVFRDNIACHGLWMDLYDHDFIVENNQFLNNDGNGIFYEISHNGIIRNNYVSGNAFKTHWFDIGAGIQVNSVDGGDVYGNTVVNNYMGIMILSEDTRNTLKNTTIHDNTIMQPSGRAAGWIYYLGVQPTNISFKNNHYHLSSLTAKQFNWNGQVLDCSNWHAKGQDTGMVCDTNLTTVSPPPNASTVPSNKGRNH